VPDPLEPCFAARPLCSIARDRDPARRNCRPKPPANASSTLEPPKRPSRSVHPRHRSACSGQNEPAERNLCPNVDSALTHAAEAPCACLPRSRSSAGAASRVTWCARPKPDTAKSRCKPSSPYAAGRNPRRATTPFAPAGADVSRCAPTDRSRPEKLSRLGDARIRCRSSGSPRHRSARVSNAEANDSSRSLSPRTTAAEATAARPPEGGTSNATHTPPKRPQAAPQDRRSRRSSSPEPAARQPPKRPVRHHASFR